MISSQVIFQNVVHSILNLYFAFICESQLILWHPGFFVGPQHRIVFAQLLPFLFVHNRRMPISQIYETFAFLNLLLAKINC